MHWDKLNELRKYGLLVSVLLLFYGQSGLVILFTPMEFIGSILQYSILYFNVFPLRIWLRMSVS